MTSIPSISPSELTHRRRMLRNHRRLKLFQSLCALAVSGIAAGLSGRPDQFGAARIKSN